MTMTRYLKPALSLLAFFAVIGIAAIASAQPAAGATVTQVMMDKNTGLATNFGWIAIGAGLCIGLAALGGSLGQGRAASAALEGIARNPGAAKQVNGPMILGLALIESLVIYALIISLLLVLKVG
jgi:F-type H+-transporting ATPase subunit c